MKPEQEMLHSWEMMRYHLKEHLISLDNMTRSLQGEMSTLGVPRKMIQENLPSLFAELWHEVIEEQTARYGDRRGAG